MKCSYKGDLKGIADPIVHKLLERQVEQGNPRDVSVFEKNRTADKSDGGFDWLDTPEVFQFWESVLSDGNYDKFYEKYPELAETTQEAQVFILEEDNELMDTLNRIEAKLDQLLATPADADDKQEKPDEQDVEIRVRVKSWKEIKAMTTKDEDGDRVFNDGGYFTKYDKQFCGMDGVVISTGRQYVTTEIDGKNNCFHYKSLEKLKP